MRKNEQDGGVPMREQEVILAGLREWAARIISAVYKRNHLTVIPEDSKRIASAIPLEFLGNEGVVAYTAFAKMRPNSRGSDGFLPTIDPFSWFEIRRHFCDLIYDYRDVNTFILHPFMLALWTDHPEENKLVIGKRYQNDPAVFWGEFTENRFGTIEVYKKVWKELIRLTIIIFVQSDGSTDGYYKINEQFFKAFKDGFEGRPLPPASIKFTEYIFSIAAKDTDDISKKPQ